MSSKKTDKRKKSITRQLHFMWIGKLLSIMLLLDLVLFVSGFCAYFSMVAREEFDSDYDIFHYDCDFYKESDEKYCVSIKKDQAREIIFSFDRQSHRKYYEIRTPELTKTEDVTVIADTFLTIVSVVLIAQLVIILYNIIFGVYKIRAKFAPIDNMARAASQLGQQAANGVYVNENKVHNLEEAIYRISPNDANEHISMSDPDLKGIEDAINCMLDKMRESYRQQSRFVSDASHELRTPIAVIQGYVNMLDRWGKEDEKILQESIDAIKNESDHMKKLVEQLLFLARGDSGRNKFTLTCVDANALVTEIYEESLMIDEKHVYSHDVTGQQLIINADESMLKQAVRILVDNAAKYTPEGEKIRIGSGIDEENVPYIYVQDNGKGIESESVQHIFERFYRTDDSRQSSTGGTGLGLSIAEWIVSRHGGYFKVKSYEDIGTRITIMLPQN